MKQNNIELTLGEEYTERFKEENKFDHVIHCEGYYF